MWITLLVITVYHIKLTKLKNCISNEWCISKLNTINTILCMYNTMYVNYRERNIIVLIDIKIREKYGSFSHQ